MCVIKYRACENWCITVRGEYRLRVFENRVLRKICGSKREEAGAEIAQKV